MSCAPGGGAGTHLSIYGSAMRDDIEALGTDMIDPVGFVEDLADALRPPPQNLSWGSRCCRAQGSRARCSAPSRTASRPSMTPVAAEGIGLRTGQDCVIVETAQDWAEAITRLSLDDKLWMSMSTAARAYAAEKFSFTAGREKMEGRGSRQWICSGRFEAKFERRTSARLRFFRDLCQQFYQTHQGKQMKRAEKIHFVHHLKKRHVPANLGDWSCCPRLTISLTILHSLPASFMSDWGYPLARIERMNCKFLGAAVYLTTRDELNRVLNRLLEKCGQRNHLGWSVHTSTTKTTFFGKKTASGAYFVRACRNGWYPRLQTSI